MYFKLFLLFYFIYVISIVFHEFCHYIMARRYGIMVDGIYIGSNYYIVHIGKVHFSCLVNLAYIEIENEQMDFMTKAQKVKFYSAGLFGNFILVIISIFIPIFFIGVVLGGINFIIIIATAIPREKSDVWKIYKCLKSKENKL